MTEREKKSKQEYDLILDDEIGFVKHQLLEGEGDEEEPSRMTEKEMRELEHRTHRERIKHDRESLPIFSYRDELLQAVEDNQILVIVGETGSGKTTQVPQYLHEAGCAPLMITD